MRTFSCISFHIIVNIISSAKQQNKQLYTLQHEIKVLTQLNIQVFWGMMLLLTCI